MHDIHGWKLLEVYFHTQQTELLFDFRARSYGKLVETAQAVFWLRENCTRLLQFSTKMTFHTQLGGMFLVYISHVLLYMMQC